MVWIIQGQNEKVNNYMWCLLIQCHTLDSQITLNQYRQVNIIGKPKHPLKKFTRLSLCLKYVRSWGFAATQISMTCSLRLGSHWDIDWRSSSVNPLEVNDQLYCNNKRFTYSLHSIFVVHQIFQSQINWKQENILTLQIYNSPQKLLWHASAFNPKDVNPREELWSML